MKGTPATLVNDGKQPIAQRLQEAFDRESSSRRETFSWYVAYTDGVGTLTQISLQDTKEQAIEAGCELLHKGCAILQLGSLFDADDVIGPQAITDLRATRIGH